MATLLLRLAAPLQSWGSDSKFETRKTDREPTKSGVVGLLAAALGLRRDDTEGLARLNGLRFAVRADQEGSLLVDFHTAKSRDTSYVTYRHYLQDAVFLAGLESEDEALLRELEAALRHPVYPLYLGRRSCPPTLPLCLGIRQGSLLDVLRTEPMQGRKPETGKLRIVADADPADPAAVPRQDLPMSFSPVHRQYGFRPVREWRLDSLNGKLYLLLLSEELPDLTGLCAQFGTGAAPETHRYEPLLERVTPGSCWQFRLTANPTRTRKDPADPLARGALKPCYLEAEQEQWLLEQAGKHGFALTEGAFQVTRKQTCHFRKNGKRPVTLLAVTYEGILQVTDPEAFREMLCQGIGRGKAYGLGLMTILHGGSSHG